MVNDARMRDGLRITGAHTLPIVVRARHRDRMRRNAVADAVRAATPHRELVVEAVVFLGEESEGEGVIQ